MDKELYKKILETEFKYVRCFSNYIEEQQSVTFKDDKLPDMYMHNFILLKDVMDKKELKSFVEEKLEEAKKENKGHLHIMLDYDIELNNLKEMIPEAEISQYCFMIILSKNFNKLNMKDDCSVIKADTSEKLSDGSLVEIKANKATMGEEFAIKRSHRKREVYENNPDLNLYVCYKGKETIGKCELFTKDGIAKIEDFDIIEEYQKQGYGTSVLRKLLEESFSEAVDIAYLIADYFDTAKDMYKKCGFFMCGIKTAILFKLTEQPNFTCIYYKILTKIS